MSYVQTYPLGKPSLFWFIFSVANRVQKHRVIILIQNCAFLEKNSCLFQILNDAEGLLANLSIFTPNGEKCFCHFHGFTINPIKTLLSVLYFFPYTN